jgi:general secretion pathway protein E
MERTESILDILVSAGLLTERRRKDILLKENFHRQKLLKARGIGIKRGMYDRTEVTIVDILASLNLSLPGDNTGLLTEERIMMEVSKHQQLDFARLDPLKLDSDLVTKTVSRPYAIKYQIVPVSLQDGRLTVATSNPFQEEGIYGIKQSSGHDVKVVVATKTDIMQVITEFYGFKSSVSAADLGIARGTDLANLEQYVKLKSISDMDATDNHVINAVEYLLHYAYSQRASDIHIEPKRDYSLVRLRIDGIMHNIHKMPKTVHPPIVSRIKGMSRMDIAEKRRPQGGRIKTSYEGHEVELRVSTLPVAFGEKVVIRIFDPTVLVQDIEELGMLKREYELFHSYIMAPYGLVLVTGPTGSGKTTTLYSALKKISSPEVNLTTIEDPVEMVYEEFNQTSVNTDIGVTFASSLRTILRQDPDIIMVGEIRDLETAENAVQAALTGHLVLSTVHTNDAPSTVARLLDLGIPPFLINTTLMGIVAQRLVRKICPHCVEQYSLTEEEAAMLGVKHDKQKPQTLSIGRGCARCRGTGYLGRAGIFEVMEITDNIKSLVEKNAEPSAVKKLAVSEGFTTLRQCVIKKILMGVTTVDEAARVTGMF